MTNSKPDPLEKYLDPLFNPLPDETTINVALAKTKASLDKLLPPIIYYDRIPNSPLGPIWVATSNEGVIAIDYDVTENEFKNAIAKKIKDVRFDRNSNYTTQTREAVLEYLSEKTDSLELPIDPKMLSKFQQQVLMAAKSIPRGQVKTYGDIARMIGKPRAFQAVGQALRFNPIPILLPCHRVIASDGSLGGYAGEMGSRKKIILLKIEGVMLT